MPTGQNKILSRINEYSTEVHQALIQKKLKLVIQIKERVSIWQNHYNDPMIGHYGEGGTLQIANNKITTALEEIYQLKNQHGDWHSKLPVIRFSMNMDAWEIRDHSPAVFLKLGKVLRIVYEVFQGCGGK
ncbi:hypothetical protein CDAR_262511 [Caerostris darwini]|uniref:Uncharacterized protein n=1 Tax=Caerostris darwini TaxID=1538125 RepID=A0AAV4RNU4_9ARAC|nr:hypothetical protein CDAR_262511 [Caerostris darwini]